MLQIMEIFRFIIIGLFLFEIQNALSKYSYFVCLFFFFGMRLILLLFRRQFHWELVALGFFLGMLSKSRIFCFYVPFFLHI